LPLYPALAEDDVITVVQAVRQAMQEQQERASIG